MRSCLLVQVRRQQEAAVTVQRWWRKTLAGRLPFRVSSSFANGKSSDNAKAGSPTFQSTAILSGSSVISVLKSPQSPQSQAPVHREERETLEEADAAAEPATAQELHFLRQKSETQDHGSPQVLNNDLERAHTADLNTRKVKTRRTVSFCADMLHSEDDPAKTQGREMPVGAGTYTRRRESTVEACMTEVQKEVDAIVERAIRRHEYIEWSRKRIFLTVLRRHHPILSLCIPNPVLTAVQRCLIGGAVLVGLSMISAAFYSYEDVSNKHADDCLLNCGGKLGDWAITARQLDIFVSALIISKPVPFCIYLLFRKEVPVIAPIVKRRDDRIGFRSSITDSQASASASGRASFTDSFRWPFRASPDFHRNKTLDRMIKSKRSSIDATGRHSGIFPLEMKLDRLEKWRRKERLGFLLAFLWWTWCIFFIVVFVFSPTLAAMASDEFSSPRPVYRDFVVTALIDVIGHLVLQPIIHFLIVTCLIGSVTKTGLLDGFVAAFPRYLDFTWAGAHSPQELAVQLHVIRDANIGRRVASDAEWAQDEGLKIALTAVKLLCHGHPIILEDQPASEYRPPFSTKGGQPDENMLKSAKEEASEVSSMSARKRQILRSLPYMSSNYETQWYKPTDRVRVSISIQAMNDNAEHPPDACSLPAKRPLRRPRPLAQPHALISVENVGDTAETERFQPHLQQPKLTEDDSAASWGTTFTDVSLAPPVAVEHHPCPASIPHEGAKEGKLGAIEWI
ncbi:unnamed protein product [Vitrella brassicaformis CCMP3155]|uniref:Uncharacterized protein n=1 Tax=Vitrella brassicaformis (strain CCMP3155) TaxID=1169540 RepID=A0A0G4EUJ0_VITBC|nr:unnamed protein product [Vitrella brassicaformis CCMP3155]|eukprot:CEM02098.1 unnamed protein product [Vitrella brassicaformis CCMP3155]